MRNVSAIILIAACLALPIFAQEPVQRSFSGDSVHLQLTGGEFRIAPSGDSRIRVTPQTQADHMSVRLNLNAFGTRADLKITAPRQSVAAVVELPRRVNLVVAMTAGTLHVGGIEGSKEISGERGEIELEIENRNQYRRIMASVRQGEIRVRSLRDKLSDPHTFEWTGGGLYDVHVRLDAGSITLWD
jgi:hypothetical protein